MGEVSTIGLDIAKLVFQAHGADASGAVVLIAQVAVSSAHASVTRTVRYAVAPRSTGTPGLVDAMSVAVGQLADTVAAMVAAR